MPKTRIDKASEEFAELEAGTHPGIGSQGEPYWYRTMVSSDRGFHAGVNWLIRQLNHEFCGDEPYCAVANWLEELSTKVKNGE